MRLHFTGDWLDTPWDRHNPGHAYPSYIL